MNDPTDLPPEYYDPVKAIVRKTLLAHIPSMSSEDEDTIYDRAAASGYEAADYALRTCACGKELDGFYPYVDHLVEVFGLEPTHFGG